MRKLVLAVVLLLLATIGCQKSDSYRMTKQQKNAWEKAGIELIDDVVLRECAQRGITYEEYMEELDSSLKDFPFPGANGEYIYMRSSSTEEPDTVVDGVGYIKW